MRLQSLSSFLVLLNKIVFLWNGHDVEVDTHTHTREVPTFF